MGFFDRIQTSSLVKDSVAYEDYKLFRELKPERAEIARLEAKAERAKAEAGLETANAETAIAKLKTQAQQRTAILGMHQAIDEGGELLQEAGYSADEIKAWKQAEAVSAFEKLGFTLPAKQEPKPPAGTKKS